LEWGIVDVDAWLRTLPRGALDKWAEFDSIEPIGEQRLQTAEITALLHRLTAHTLAGLGTDMKPIDIDGYMPPRYVSEAKPKKKPKTVPANSFHSLAAAFGLKEIVDGRNDKLS